MTSPSGPRAPSRPRRPGWCGADAVSGAAFLALAVGAGLTGWRLPIGTLHRPGPGFFPLGLAALLAGLAAMLMVRGLARPGAALASLWPERAGRRRLLAMVATLLAYVGLVEIAGFLVCTFALFVAMIRGVAGRGWGTAVAAGAIGSAASYLLFARALRVTLPSGLWLP